MELPSTHWLRHAHASHAIDNGAPVSLVSQTLGHADLKTTSVYAHAKPGESSSSASSMTPSPVMRTSSSMTACGLPSTAPPLNRQRELGH